MTVGYSILFICTGNVFRSMTAEHALKAVLGGSRHAVGSAGLKVPPHCVLPYVAAHLRRKRIDVSRHRPRVVTRAMLAGADLAIAMGIEHRECVRKAFGRDLPLFSQVAYGTEEALRDVWEVVPDWETNREAARVYAESVMDYICDGMPAFVRNMAAFGRAD
jgi:protein-tyrosine phosphatase